MHPNEKVTPVPTTDNYTEQHVQYNKKFSENDSSFSLFITDTQWTAEAASNGWVEPQPDISVSNLISSVVLAGRYLNKQYAIPPGGNGGVLFYRKDLVAKPPETWSQLEGACSIAVKHKIDCYAGQYARFEGLTVNFVEAVYSAGGEIVNSDGALVINSDAARRGLQTMVDMFNNGTVSKEALTYKELDGLKKFANGELLFWRGWPYLYQTMLTAIKDKAALGVTSLPGVTTIGSAGVYLNYYGPNKDTAKDFTRFLVSDEGQRIKASYGSSPSSIAIYKNAVFPNAALVYQSLLLAKPRPQFVRYSEATEIIQTEVGLALTGAQSVDDTISNLDVKLRRIL